MRNSADSWKSRNKVSRAIDIKLSSWLVTLKMVRTCHNSNPIIDIIVIRCTRVTRRIVEWSTTFRINPPVVRSHFRLAGTRNTRPVKFLWWNKIFYESQCKYDPSLSEAYFAIFFSHCNQWIHSWTVGTSLVSAAWI